jgi:hypothetical protein
LELIGQPGDPNLGGAGRCGRQAQLHPTLINGCGCGSTPPAASNWAGHGLDYLIDMALAPASDNRCRWADPDWLPRKKDELVVTH